jgi:hypothetical protein
MATFKIGQRVRIVGAVKRHELIGREATVVSSLMWANHVVTNQGYCGYDVSVDNLGTCWHDGTQLCFSPENLAPIQPERNKTIEWTDCCFTPDGKYKEDSLTFSKLMQLAYETP